MHPHKHSEVLLKCRFGFSRAAVSPSILPEQLPGVRSCWAREHAARSK